MSEDNGLRLRRFRDYAAAIESMARRCALAMRLQLTRATLHDGAAVGCMDVHILELADDRSSVSIKLEQELVLSGANTPKYNEMMMTICKALSRLKPGRRQHTAPLGAIEKPARLQTAGESPRFLSHRRRKTREKAIAASSL